jgi:SecD/SecF fusion protein
MSVDANVLIYERIREELKAGAALRMAIRNGFGRAMSAIIDSNLTTIISGIALYAFATDQVKGFAVTMILGILTSMFTAIFFARLVFDVVERRGWVKQVRMMRILQNPDYDFLRVRYWAIGASLVIIGIGLVAVYFRGATLLDIDFTGGSSVAFTLKNDAKMPIAAVRDVMMETPVGEKNLLIVEQGDSNTRYAIDTSEQSIDEVKRVIREAFPDKLMTFKVDVGPLKPFAEGDLQGSEATLAINTGPDYNDDDGVSHDALKERIRATLVASGHTDLQPTLSSELYHAGSVVRYKDWTVRLPGLDEAAAQRVFDQLKAEMNSEPMFPMANAIGGRVSGDMKQKAAAAIFISLLGMVAYLWFRFQKLGYGLAAATALLHDVLVTIGLLALSRYFVEAVPGLASILKIQSFQISLTIVAALLTIIGFSVNDTIVTFDRLREIKGKSPRLTAEMVNSSVNQTLGRTILTSLTVFIVILILYFWGGEGIHSFAYSFLIGVIAGTYSTVYIAAPVLLWLSGTPSMTVDKDRASSKIERVASASSR